MQGQTMRRDVSECKFRKWRMHRFYSLPLLRIRGNRAAVIHNALSNRRPGNMNRDCRVFNSDIIVDRIQFCSLIHFPNWPPKCGGDRSTTQLTVRCCLEPYLWLLPAVNCKIHVVMNARPFIIIKLHVYSPPYVCSGNYIPHTKYQQCP